MVRSVRPLRGTSQPDTQLGQRFIAGDAAASRALHPGDHQGASPALPPSALELDVAARLARQEVLDREEPPFCWFIIGEAALRPRSAGRGDARSARPSADAGPAPEHTIQVSPFSLSDCPACDGPTTVFELPDAGPTGYAKGYEAGRIIESPAEAAKLICCSTCCARMSSPSPRASSPRFEVNTMNNPSPTWRKASYSSGNGCVEVVRPGRDLGTRHQKKVPAPYCPSALWPGAGLLSD